MGLLSSLFNPATGMGSDGTPPTAAATPTAPPAPAVPDAAAIAAKAAADAAAAAAAKPGSQLDGFKDLWQTPKNDKGEPIQFVDPLSQPVLQVDPAKLAEAASKLNFMANIPAENIQKALGGDQQAFAEVINNAVRNAVVGISASQGQLLQQVVTANNQRLVDSLPTHIKRTQLTQQSADNPILEHPSVAPLVEALKLAEFNKNPRANPADVHQKVVDYITGLGKAITDTSTQQQQQSDTKKEVDWLEWSKS